MREGQEMINKQGDVFTTEADFIAHGCNIEGVMGAGVAAQVREKYPVAYEVYHNFCEAEKFHVGDCLAVETNGKIIFNLATQDKPGPHARLEWVSAALQKAAENALTDNEGGVVIAMPQIGAGIGGLDWAEVEATIKDVESVYDSVQFEVWEYAAV